MNIRDLIKEDFGADLPINGGSGNSIESAVVIERSGFINDYVSTEYDYLKYIGLGRGIEWKSLGQELITHNNRTIEKIKIETKETTETEIITQIETYYFDITDCLDEPLDLTGV